MSTLNGNNIHTNIINKHLELIPDERRVYAAQLILNQEDDNICADSWQKLSQKLYKANMETFCIGDWGYIKRQANTVFEWYQEIGDSSSMHRRGITTMYNEWQNELINTFKAKNEVNTIYFFKENDFENIYIITNDEPKTSWILEFTEEYMSILDSYPEVKCEFLVLSKQEANSIIFPKNTTKVVLF